MRGIKQAVCDEQTACFQWIDSFAVMNCDFCRMNWKSCGFSWIGAKLHELRLRRMNWRQAAMNCTALPCIKEKTTCSKCKRFFSMKSVPFGTGEIASLWNICFRKYEICLRHIEVDFRIMRKSVWLYAGKRSFPLHSFCCNYLEK